MSGKFRMLSLTVSLMGAFIVLTSPVSASVRQDENGCDVTNDWDHCCKCDGASSPNGCALSSTESGRIKCTTASCGLDLCVMG